MRNIGAPLLALRCARLLWTPDHAAGRAGVFMRDARDRKYPRAGSSWTWFWVFPQAEVSVDPRTDLARCHHGHEQAFQRAFKRSSALYALP